MGKHYNYFDDDDFSTQDKDTELFKDKDFAKKAKYILSVIGVNILLFFKKIGTIFKNRQNREHSNLRSVLFSLIAVLLAIVITVTTVMFSANRVNSKQSKFNAAAYKVCSKYIEEFGVPNYKYMNSEYGVKGCMLTGLCVVREIDFNNDGTAELLLAYNNGDVFYEDVWGFVSGEFKKIYSEEPAQSKDKNDDLWIAIYSNGKEFCLAEHDKNDLTKVTEKSLRSDKFKPKRKFKYDDKNQTYSYRSKDVTDEFERIRFSVLRENVASNIVDRTLDTVDGFSEGNSSLRADNGFVANNINNVYYDIIKDYTAKYGVAKYDSESGCAFISGLACVDLIDFNGDGTKELLLVYRRGINRRSEDSRGNYISVVDYKYFCDVYSWNGSVAKLVYQNEGLSNLLDDKKSVYYIINHGEKNNYLCFNTFNVQNYGKVVHATSKIMKFNGEVFKQKFKASYEKDYGYTEHYVNDKYVGKTEFENQGGYKVPLFDGSEDYNSEKWTVTYVQCKASKGSVLKNRIEKTESNIKSLYPAYNPSNMSKK